MKIGSPQRITGCQVKPAGTVRASTSDATTEMAVNCSLDAPGPKPFYATTAFSLDVTAPPSTTARAPAAPKPRAARRDSVVEAMSRK